MKLSQKIRRAVRQRHSQRLSREMTLASAIWRVRPPRASHEPLLAQLPEFIDAELEHRSTAPEFLELKRHLLICSSCVTIYLDLLETAQWDAQGKLLAPQAAQKPFPPSRPDLSFLNPTDTGE